MGDKGGPASDRWDGCPKEDARREILVVNARLRHFRGIAANVLKDAFRLWGEIGDALQDPRSCEEILEGGEWHEPLSFLDQTSELREKFHLLGIHIDYARRLCEGSIGKGSQGEGEI